MSVHLQFARIEHYSSTIMQFTHQDVTGTRKELLLCNLSFQIMKFDHRLQDYYFTLRFYRSCHNVLDWTETVIVIIKIITYHRITEPHH